MLLTVCKEYDASQIAFPLHIVKITVFFAVVWMAIGDSRVLSPFMDTGIFYTTGGGCLVKDQVGYSCVLNVH